MERIEKEETYLNIPLGEDFFFLGDADEFTIRKITEKSNTILGHYYSPIAALNAVLKHRLKRSNAIGIEGLISEIEGAMEDIKSIVDGMKGNH